MASATEKTQVDRSWSKMKNKAIPAGWYDIILLNGEEYHEVYAEHGEFRFIDSRPSIHFNRVEWVRLHG